MENSDTKRGIPTREKFIEHMINGTNRADFPFIRKISTPMKKRTAFNEKTTKVTGIWLNSRFSWENERKSIGGSAIVSTIFLIATISLFCSTPS
jgi:hypothetical protein